MRPIVDCHCHIYPEKIAARAVESIGAFYSIPMGMDGTEETMRREGAEAGITHHLVFSVATTPRQVRSVNRFIAERVASSEGCMTGLGTMHPESEDLAGDMEDLIALGLKGVKLHPDIQGFRLDDPRNREIYRLCAAHGVPVFLHTGDTRYDFSNPNRLIPMLEAYPELLFIGAHFGGWSLWEEAPALLCKFPNLVVDCSSSLYRLTPERAAELIRTYGAERVLFGTDYPMWRPKEELARFAQIPLSEEERDLILWKNAERIFGLSAAKKLQKK